MSANEKLVAENRSLRAILQGAVVFFENHAMEELYISIAEENHVFPTLRTKQKVEGCCHSELTLSDLDDTCVEDDQPKSTLVHQNGLPDSTVHTPHSLSTDTASASNSQTLTSSGNERSKSPGIRVSQNQSPLKTSRSDVTGYSQQNESNGRSGASVPLRNTREGVGKDGKAQPYALYTDDLTALLMKMNELEERLKPHAENDVASLIGESVSDIVIAGCTQQRNEYVFVVHTTWTNKQRFKLYRKYEVFFKLQNTLQKLFPEETGKNVKHLLPMRDHVLCIVGRINSKHSLRPRQKIVNNFCKYQVLEEQRIKCSTPVTNFFMPTKEDLQLQSISKATMTCFVSPTCQYPAGAQFMECTVIASHEESSDHELTVRKGEVVTVLKREITGWSLVMKPGGKGSKESKTLGYVPSSLLKQKEDKAGLESTQELEKECLGFLSSVAAQKEAQFYGSSKGFSPFTSRLATQGLKAPPMPKSRSPKPGEELDDRDGNEPGDKSPSPKEAVADCEAVEKSPAGLSMDRNKGCTQGHCPLGPVMSLPTPPNDPDDLDIPYFLSDHNPHKAQSFCSEDAQDYVMRSRKNDFTRRRIQVARRKALAVKSGSIDCEKSSPSTLESEDKARAVSTPTSLS